MAAKRRRRKNRKMLGVFAIILLIVVVVIILALTMVIKKYTPSKETSNHTEYYGLTTESSMVVVVDNERSEINGLYMDGRAYVDYETVHDEMNLRFFWDGTEQVLRYTLPDALISVGPDTSEYTLGKGKEDAGYTICTVSDGVMYLALDFVKEYTDIRYKVYENPDRVVVSTQWGELSYTKVKKNTQIREKGGIKSPILAEVSKGDLVTIIEEEENWAKVCSEDGFIGYLKKDCLGNQQTVEFQSTFEDVTYDKITKNYNISLLWHMVTNQTANQSIENVLATSPGINVISPTWFYLNDNKGGIMNLASSDYVTACHAKGVEVWALVNNMENPNVDMAAVLNTTSSRENLVNQLISAALRYDLDGINVDFEALSGDVGDGFIQFVRELSLKCANNDIVLSVDNYPPSAYTGLYYRSEQANFADYVILMAYDEHYKGSEAGSVASIGWVRQSVEDTLEEVPADQLVLGIPLYTRVWKLTPDSESDTGYKTTSEAVGMSEVDTRIAANDADMIWQEDVGQFYVEYEHAGSTYKIWVEEQNSIEEKMKVYKEQGLAGVAFWESGYEKATIWNAVKEYIQ